MFHRRAALLSGLLLALCVSTANSVTHAGSFSVSSPATRVTLLELYTSEGCSSCPPADRWLSGLQQAPGLWQDFIPVAFHVDYWDYIGWPDRFASPAYTARQRVYAAQQSMRTIYTPGVFKNGKEWRHWRSEPRRPEKNDLAGVLSLRLDGQTANVRFETEEQIATLSVTVALLGFDIETEVKAGENKGRTLTHDFVVLAIEQAPLERIKDGKNPGFHGMLSLPASAIDAERFALVAWVNAADNQDPVQAVGGWLMN